MPVTIEKEIAYARQIPGIGSWIATALDRLQSGINNLGQNVAVDATSIMPAPPTPQALTIKTDGNGTVHGVINDSNPIQKNLHYFVEYDTDPSFPQPHVVHLGVSRTLHPFQLPAQDDNGNPQKFYFRTYSQYPGSHPGAPIIYGGTQPIAVNPGGSSRMTLLSSTGSGTALNTGQQGNSGYGRNVFRILTATPTQAPKVAGQR